MSRNKAAQSYFNIVCLFFHMINSSSPLDGLTAGARKTSRGEWLIPDFSIGFVMQHGKCLFVAKLSWSQGSASFSSTTKSEATSFFQRAVCCYAPNIADSEVWSKDTLSLHGEKVGFMRYPPRNLSITPAGCPGHSVESQSAL
jgi:hypothetical protein